MYIFHATKAGKTLWLLQCLINSISSLLFSILVFSFKKILFLFFSVDLAVFIIKFLELVESMYVIRHNSLKKANLNSTCKYFLLKTLKKILNLSNSAEVIKFSRLSWHGKYTINTYLYFLNKSSFSFVLFLYNFFFLIWI